MTTTKRVLSLALIAILVASAPLGAFTLIELQEKKVPVVRGDKLRTHVRLSQAALCDGSVKLKPGEYDVEVLSMGDGSVRASFFDKNGRKAGEANGIIAVLKQGQAALKQGEAAPPAGTNLPAVQSQGNAAHKVAPSSPSGQAAINFSKLGLGPSSRASFSRSTASGSHKLHVSESMGLVAARRRSRASASTVSRRTTARSAATASASSLAVRAPGSVTWRSREARRAWTREMSPTLAKCNASIQSQCGVAVS
jgi:hypothetical protein